MLEVLDPTQNRWLVLRSGVVLSPSIAPAIAKLDKFFARRKTRSYVSSGVRTTADQIRIILEWGWREHLQKEFPNLQGATAESTTMMGSQVVPLWTAVWGRLLTLGIMVNPPVSTPAPFTYVHPSGRTIKAGTVIGPSPHFAGTAFDIEGSGGVDPTVNDELAAVKDGMASGEIAEIIGYLVERANNCLHVDCRKV